MKPAAADIRREVRPKSNDDRLYELKSGLLQCGACSADKHTTCRHVIDAVRDGQDVLERWENNVVRLPDFVGVPLFGNPPVLVSVQLAAPDSLGMREVLFVDGEDDETLGFVAPREGRLALRELVIGHLVSRFYTRPACKNGCADYKLRAPASAQGIADTLALLGNERCAKCQSGADGDDLIPDD